MKIGVFTGQRLLSNLYLYMFLCYDELSRRYAKRNNGSNMSAEGKKDTRNISYIMDKAMQARVDGKLDEIYIL